MFDRRQIIESVLSSINEAESQVVNISGCESVPQINVFPGGSINITISNAEHFEKHHEDDCFLDEDQRKKVYKICHRIANEYSMHPQMLKYIEDRWGCSSMGDLPDTALACLLHFMREIEESKSG